MKRIRAKLGRELYRAFKRPDNVPEDFTLCYVRFLYRAHMVGH